MKKIKLFIIVSGVFFTTYSYAQSDSEKKEILRTAANISSGNYRDVLTNFFQVAFNDLTGPDKRFKFSSNLFAIKLKSNPNLDIDYNFKKQTFWRNSNIDFDLKLDSNYKFNGVSLGYKYAIVNKRDYAIAKDFRYLYQEAMKDYDQIHNLISAEVAVVYVDKPIELTAINLELNSFLRNDSIKFKTLSPELKAIITKVMNKTPDGEWSFAKMARGVYTQLVDSYKKKLLWTVSGNTATYSDAAFVSNIDFETQATSSLLETGNHSHLEFDLKATYNLVDDTLRLNRDLKRQTFAFEGGFNWVFKNKKNSKPTVEVKATTSYNAVLSGRYLNEAKDKFTLNSMLRIRITDNIWFPLEVKYDPDGGKVFGFLSVKSNFDWLSKK